MLSFKNFFYCPDRSSYQYLCTKIHIAIVGMFMCISWLTESMAWNRRRFPYKIKILCTWTECFLFHLISHSVKLYLISNMYNISYIRWGINWGNILRYCFWTEVMLLNCGIGEDSLESLGLQGDQISPF